MFVRPGDRKSTRLNSSHTVIYTLSLHDALPICNCLRPLERRRKAVDDEDTFGPVAWLPRYDNVRSPRRSEEHTSELQSHSDLHSFPTRRSSDLQLPAPARAPPQGCR